MKDREPLKKGGEIESYKRRGEKLTRRILKSSTSSSYKGGDGAKYGKPAGADLPWEGMITDVKGSHFFSLIFFGEE